MVERWERIGHYSILHYKINRNVSFVTDAVKPVIIRIDIHSHENSEPYIRCIFSPFYYQELINYCEKQDIRYDSQAFDVFQGSPKAYTSRLAKLDRENYCKIIKLFEHFNAYIQPLPFSKELLEEIKTIYTCSLYKHNIPTIAISLRDDAIHLGDLISQEIESIPTQNALSKNVFSALVQDQIHSIKNYPIRHKARLLASSISIERYHPLDELYQHIVPAMPLDYYHDVKNNPTNRRANSLASLISSDNNIEEYETYLLEGENPDERENISDLTPLTATIIAQSSLAPFELLLWYGANPFKRLHCTTNKLFNSSSPIKYPYLFDMELFNIFSPIELAIFVQQTDKANAIVNAFSRIKNQNQLLQPNSRRLKIISSKTQCIDKAITSYFLLNNNHQIKTTLKPVEDLTELEKQSVYHLFKTNFSALDDKDDIQLASIFKKDFSANKLIDIIYDSNQIIGFNLFEIISPEHSKKCMVVHCAYGAIAPEYRGYGLMIFLTFRLAYILQALLPEKHVAVFYLAAHYNSYRMVNFQHSPKYQSPLVQNSIIHTIRAIFGEQVKYYHHFLTNYIVDNVQVKGSPNKAKMSLNEKVFDQIILGHKEPANNEFRSAPVMFFVGDENYKHIWQAADVLGVNFDLHVQEFAHELNKLFPIFNTDQISLKALMKSSSAFFKPHSNLLNDQDKIYANPFHAKL